MQQDISSVAHLSRSDYATSARLVTPGSQHLRIHWKVPARLLFVGACALVVWGIWNRPVPRQQPLPMQPVAAPYIEQARHDENVSVRVESAEAEENAALARQEEDFPLQTSLSSLQRANPASVPGPLYTPSSRKLTQLNSHPVPAPVRTQIAGVYRRWKWRQGEDVSQLGRLMNLYAPDARIFTGDGKEVSWYDLHQIVIQLRQGGYFTSVADQKPLQWSQNARGDQVELLAYHLYKDDAHNRLWGQRRLVWKKRDGRWLIIRDDFPPNYFSR